jgi:hypothetical protein
MRLSVCLLVSLFLSVAVLGATSGAQEADPTAAVTIATASADPGIEELSAPEPSTDSCQELDTVYLSRPALPPNFCEDCRPCEKAIDCGVDNGWVMGVCVVPSSSTGCGGITGTTVCYCY